MKEFFKELFEYNYHFNREIISVLNENQEKASEKCMSLLSHILNVHQIWNAKFQSSQAPYNPWEMLQIQSCQEMDKKNFEDSIHIIDQHDMNQMIRYSNSKGQIFNNSAQDLLFQIINHSTYHRAQIASEFRQSGLEPILTDYIYYKWT